MKNSLTSLVVLIAVVCTALYIMQAREVLRLQAENNELYHEVSALRARAGAALRKLNDDNARAAAHAILPISMPSADATNVSAETEAARNYLLGLAALLQSPEMREAARTDVREKIVHEVYGSFFETLILTDPELEQLGQLLVDRYLLKFGPNMEMVKVGLDPDTRRQVVQQITRDRAAVDARILQLLGKDAFDRYVAYQKTEEIRLVVSEFNKWLSARSRRLLTVLQHEKLVTAVAQEESVLRAQGDLVDIELVAPDELTDSSVEAFMRQHRLMYARAAAQAKTFLTAEQGASLDAFLDSILTQTETRLRLTARLFRK